MQYSVVTATVSCTSAGLAGCVIVLRTSRLAIAQGTSTPSFPTMIAVRVFVIKAPHTCVRPDTPPPAQIVRSLWYDGQCSRRNWSIRT
eukprot:scaffold5277_cov404-Prasinococcus_capsulatus_cf.AAC.4